MARILLAVPGPAFLVFSAIQQFNKSDFTPEELSASFSTWGLSASFTQLKTGQTFAVAVFLITSPLWILSLLIAQIEEKPPRSLQEWLEAYRDNRLERLPTSTLEAFCKKYGLDAGGKRGELVARVEACLENEKKPPGSLREWLEAYRGNRLESFTTSTLEAFCKKYGPNDGGKKGNLGKKGLVASVEECLKKEEEEEERKKKESTPAPKESNDTSTPTTESTKKEEPKRTPIERLVDLCKWDPRIWSWPKAFEAFLFICSVYGYTAIYESNNSGWSGVMFIYLFGTFLAVLALNMVTKIVRSIMDYQYDQKVPYHSFVNLQAFRLSIHTIFGVGVTAYGMSAQSRVVLTSNLQPHFDELSLNGIVCADRDAFRTAFEASAANASCPARPNCGYASFEDLCQAVQYSPMVQAVGVDVAKVLLFNFVSWLLVSVLVFGTGRASADKGYAQLLSRHMLVAMVLGFAQLVSAIYSFLRLLLLVPLLRLPRPAAYFDRPDLIVRELPFFLYGRSTDFDFWLAIFVHVLIAIALNFDFLKKYASGLSRVEQEAIDKLKKEMTKMKMNEETRQMECEWSDEAPYFYFIPAQVVRDCKTRSLPPMQALRADGHLKQKKVRLAKAFKGEGVIKKILFVSHRWEEPGRPDVNGVQLKAIQAFLNEHPEIKWVWFDYSSMPQKIGGIDTRTPKEKAEFQLMLACIADLYLTAQVLILLDGSYASRFWTLTEAWCSMQTATQDGLHNSISKTEEADFTGSDVQVGSRCTIKCIHNAAKETTSTGLVDLVATKTPENMYKILDSPDVNVTNDKDKEAMLPVIQKTNERVIEGFRNGFKNVDSKNVDQQTSPKSPRKTSFEVPPQSTVEQASAEASQVRQSPTLEIDNARGESSSSPASASEVMDAQIKYLQASEKASEK